MLADIQQAINVEKKLHPSKTALKDVLGRVVAEYNRMTSVRRHRIDGARRQLVYNLFLNMFGVFGHFLKDHVDNFSQTESSSILVTKHIGYRVNSSDVF